MTEGVLAVNEGPGVAIEGLKAAIEGLKAENEELTVVIEGVLAVSEHPERDPRVAGGSRGEAETMNEAVAGNGWIEPGIEGEERGALEESVIWSGLLTVTPGPGFMKSPVPGGAGLVRVGGAAEVVIGVPLAVKKNAIRKARKRERGSIIRAVLSATDVEAKF